MPGFRKITEKGFIKFLPLAIFFLGSFTFFAFFNDYIGFFQEKLSLFIFTSDFLKENLRQPGSLLKYFGGFLTVFCYYKLTASLIISLIICLIVYFLSRILNLLSGRKSVLIPIITGSAFFILQSNYQYLVYNNLGVLLQIVFFYYTIRYLKGFWPIVIFPIWYWINGAFAWIFFLIYIVYLIRISIRKEWPKIFCLILISFFIIWLLGKYIVFQTFRNLLIFPFSKDDTGSQFILLILATSFIVLIPFIADINLVNYSWYKAIKRFNGFFQVSIFTVLLIAGLSIWRFDRVLREYFHAEDLFFRKEYNELTKFITDHPTNNKMTLFLNNIALCETGRLNDLLFHFPQSPDGQTLFLKWEMLGEVLKHGGYFYYTTGMINEAQRWAYENMVMKGLSPEGVRMLIRTEIINGNFNVAAKYISLLKKSFFYRKDAKKFEKLLFNEDAINSDPELGAKRKEKISHDFFSITDNPFVNIERVLSADSLNIKAFNYKLAYLLLSEDYKRLSADIPGLRGMGYTRMPVHLEEAWLVCRMSGKELASDTGRLSINPQTEARFIEFLRTFEAYGKDLRKARPALQKKFGNTFWFYAFYH